MPLFFLSIHTNKLISAPNIITYLPNPDHLITENIHSTDTDTHEEVSVLEDSDNESVRSEQYPVFQCTGMIVGV